MAAGTKSKFRLWNTSNHKQARLYNISESAIMNKYPMVIDPFYIIELEYTGTLSSSATEVSIPNAVCTLSTPAKLNVVSSSADDTNAAGGYVKKVVLVGLNSLYVPTIEEVSLNGVGYVETSTTWYAVFHMYASAWGTGGNVSAGTIILTDDDVPTTTYLTIGTGANESDGMTFIVPSGYGIELMNFDAELVTQNNVAYFGLLSASFKGFMNGVSPDFDEYKQKLSHYGYNPVKPNKYVYISNSNASNIMIKEIYSGGAENFHFNATFLLYNASTL
jgi:hypothetical protein